MTDRCVFCDIVAGEAPSHVVHEDDRTLAFLDIFPITRGHTLVIPKAHARDLFDADPEDVVAVPFGVTSRRPFALPAMTRTMACVGSHGWTAWLASSCASTAAAARTSSPTSTPKTHRAPATSSCTAARTASTAGTSCSKPRTWRTRPTAEA